MVIMIFRSLPVCCRELLCEWFAAGVHMEALALSDKTSEKAHR